MIFITGDTHGNHDIKKLNTKCFPEQLNLTKSDYLIICGDFGMIWNDDNEDKYWRKWLNDKNFTTLFCDGNHENFELINKYPITEWNGGKVHFIEENIIHLMRGQVYTIDGLKFFVMGGATSIDKESRKNRIDWWAEEVPNYVECEEGLSNLEKHNWEVDYIITHTCSIEALEQIWINFRNINFDDIVNKYLQVVHENVKYKHWYFGHFHEDQPNLINKNTMLFNEIIKIKGKE